MQSKKAIIAIIELFMTFVSLLCLYPHPDERMALSDAETVGFSCLGLFVFFASYHAISHLLYEGDGNRRFWFLVTVYVFYFAQTFIRGYIGLSILQDPFDPNVIAVSAVIPLLYAVLSTAVFSLRQGRGHILKAVIFIAVSVALCFALSIMLYSRFSYDEGIEALSSLRDYSLWGSGIALSVIAAAWLIYVSRTENLREWIYAVTALFIILVLEIRPISELYLSLIGDLRARSAYELVPVAAVAGMAGSRLITKNKKAVLGVVFLVFLSISVPFDFGTAYFRSPSLSERVPADAYEVFDMIDAVCEADEIEPYALLPERLMSASREADTDIGCIDVDWHRTTYGEAECVNIARANGCRIIVIDRAIVTGDILSGNAYVLRANVGMYGVYVRFW